MCNYHINQSYSAKPCEANNYINKLDFESLPDKIIIGDRNLPIDKLGQCIFHSEDIEWKMQNHFQTWMETLLVYIRQLDKSLYMLTGPPTLKEINFSGFYFIGEEYELSNGRIEEDFRFRELNWTDHIVLNMEHARATCSIYFEGCILSKTEINMNHVTFDGEMHFSNCELAQLSLNDSKFNAGILIRNCEFSNYAEFGGMRVRNIIQIIDTHFKTNAYFNMSRLDCEAILFSDNSFIGKADFSGCTFYCDASFENCTFEKDLNFTNAQFLQSISFTGNIYHDNVYFISTEPKNKVFNDIVEFMFIDKQEEVQGRLIFDHVNYSNILKEGREELAELERQNRVTIGTGCIKYRLQTAPVSIKTNDINRNIAKELANSFANYFTASSGLNLGVEFTDKSIHSITLFYFTDENISQNEFNKRLKNAEEHYWDFEVADTDNLTDQEIANQIENYVSKVAILTRIGMLKDQNLWPDKYTKDILKAISFSKFALGSTDINIKIKNMYIGNINAQPGSQINIADTIKKIEFKPQLHDFSTENFKEISQILTTLNASEIIQLRHEVQQIPSENTDQTLLNNFRTKFDEFAMRHGTPVMQGLGASVIYDVLKYIFSHT